MPSARYRPSQYCNENCLDRRESPDQGFSRSLRMALGASLSRCVEPACNKPYSPWHHGMIENTNSVLRQCLPKNIELARWSPADLDAVAATLNSRPRIPLGRQTPAEAPEQHLRSLH